MDPHASIDIDAAIEQVWEVMLDTASYAEWNPFVVRADCPQPPTVGDPIRLHVRWSTGGEATSPERISIVEPPHLEGDEQCATLAYVYEGLPAKLGLVRGTRYQRLSQRPGGPTHYATVEEFSGPLVPFAGPARVEDGFRRHAAALKLRCEQPTAPAEP